MSSFSWCSGEQQLYVCEGEYQVQVSRVDFLVQ